LKDPNWSSGSVKKNSRFDVLNFVFVKVAVFLCETDANSCQNSFKLFRKKDAKTICASNVTKDILLCVKAVLDKTNLQEL